MRNQQVENFVKTLQLRSGERWRGNCPECGGDNSFQITFDVGRYAFICFRSSCSIAGIIEVEPSLNNVIDTFMQTSRAYLDKGRGSLKELSASASGGIFRVDLSDVDETYPIPDYWVYGHHYAICLQYMAANGVVDAYGDKRVDVRYDPKLDRAVFLIKKDGECYGAIGRALDSSVKPKWYKYSVDCADVPFMCLSIYPAKEPALVIVEDCASACAASSVYDSLALLGTTLSDAYIPTISTYDYIIIALDKDATAKSIELQRRLSIYCKDVDIIPLQQDLKYESKENLKEMLCSF